VAPEETCQDCGKTISRRARANVWHGERVICTLCLKLREGAEKRLAAAVRLAGRAGAVWLVDDGGKQRGPFTTHELIRLIDNRQIDIMRRIWRDGMSTWKPAAQLFTLREIDGKTELRDFGQGDGTYRPNFNQEQH
jgi:hypothetical protein